MRGGVKIPYVLILTKKTDDDYQDGHFFFNHPERGGCSAA